MGGKTLKVDKIVPEGGTLEIAGVVNGVGIEYQTQWNHSVSEFNNINYTAGSVSIGTTDDNSNLQVEGNVYVSSNLEVGTANLYVDTETTRVGVGTKAPQATLHVEGNVYASSNIGIGTSTPQYSLDVHGAANVGVLATTSVSGDGYLLSNISSSAVVGGIGVWTINTDDDTIFYQTSNVGIGKTDPTTELDVEGIVTATEFVGPLTGRASIATNADNADNVYVNVQTTQSETRRIIFGPDESSDGNRALFSHDNLNYVASTGILTAEEFSGRGSQLTNLTRTNMPELVADSVKIGSGAGGTGQGSSAIAIGKDAGTTSQHDNSIILNATGTALNSVGTSRFYVKPMRFSTDASNVVTYNATTGEVLDSNIAVNASGQITAVRFVGDGSGLQNLPSAGYNPLVDKIKIGNGAGVTSQGADAVAIGHDAGTTSQGLWAVAVGNLAGNSSQGNSSVAIGTLAGTTSQEGNCVALGYQAGQTGQRSHSTAIGVYSGNSGQGYNCVAVGHNAGNSSQGSNGVAVGYHAGDSSQGSNGVAVGYKAGETGQGGNSVAVGPKAGNSGQGNNGVAIGNSAGETNQHDNSIILNATGTALNSVGASRFYVKPMRFSTDASNVVTYNATTGEVLNSSIAADASGHVGIGGAADANNELKVHGSILATNDITAFSDRRLKSKIERIEGALDKVCALGGYTFTMNDKPSTGLIAQEVLEVLPEAVHGSEETHYSLAYGNMIGLLVEAVKELRALI